MQRAAAVERDVVGDIDQRVDRLMPMAFSRRCSQSGLGPFFTPLIKRPAKTGQALAVALSKSSSIGPDWGSCVHRLERVGLERAEAGGGKVAGDAAHAETVWPVRRDGDLDHRIVEAERPAAGLPILASAASSMMPVCSSDSSSSRSDSSMPLD